MIVVIGSPAWRAVAPSGPAGRACAIALAAASRGARVELAGRVGEDPEGDALLFALTRGGVGHAAVIRDPARRTPIAAPPLSESDDVSPLTQVAAPPIVGIRLDAADVTLTLRYLDPDGVLVVTDDVAPDALAAAIEGGEFAGMRLVLLVDEASGAGSGAGGSGWSGAGWSGSGSSGAGWSGAGSGGPGSASAGSGSSGSGSLPADATVFAVPEPGDDDSADSFDALVGAFAAALDAGATPKEAFTAASQGAAWEPVAAEA